MPSSILKTLFLAPFLVAFALMVRHDVPPERTDDGRVIVTYWEKWTGFEGEAIQAAVNEFNETVGRQKNIKVVLLIQGDIEQKVKLATAGGSPPDLVGLYSYNVAVYASQNALMPLDDWLTEAGITEELYIPNYWRLTRHDGKTWCITSAPASLALFWNKNHFREAGLDPDTPPATLEELTAIGHKLTRFDDKGNILRMGFLPAEPGWWSYAWPWWFGGALWNGKDVITANGPENVTALEWVKREYVDRYGPKRLSQFKGSLGAFASADNGFFSGKVSMELQGVWFPNFINEYAPASIKNSYGVAVFPSAAGAPQGVTIAESDVIGIPTGARHPREAFEFIKFMASRKGIEILCRGQGKHSPHRQPSPGFFDDHPNEHVRLFHELSFSRQARQTPATGIWKEYQQALGVAFDNIWNPDAANPTTPRQELDAVQERIQFRLDQDLLGRRIRQGLPVETPQGDTP